MAKWRIKDGLNYPGQIKLVVYVYKSAPTRVCDHVSCD